MERRGLNNKETCMCRSLQLFKWTQTSVQTSSWFAVVLRLISKIKMAPWNHSGMKQEVRESDWRAGLDAVAISQSGKMPEKCMLKGRNGKGKREQTISLTDFWKLRLCKRLYFLSEREREIYLRIIPCFPFLFFPLVTKSVDDPRKEQMKKIALKKDWQVRIT